MLNITYSGNISYCAIPKLWLLFLSNFSIDGMADKNGSDKEFPVDENTVATGTWVLRRNSLYSICYNLYHSRKCLFSFHSKD